MARIQQDVPQHTGGPSSQIWVSNARELIDRNSARTLPYKSLQPTRKECPTRGVTPECPSRESLKNAKSIKQQLVV